MIDLLFQPTLAVVPLIAWGALAVIGATGYFFTKETESSALDDVKNTAKTVQNIALISLVGFGLWLLSSNKLKFRK